MFLCAKLHIKRFMIFEHILDQGDHTGGEEEVNCCDGHECLHF